ncbi:MAG: protein translocase subunit SecD [Opitutales bacterium]|nr:protein translocase subunit SecD [Opitutales bacterium]
MKGKILWKFILSALVFVWALSTITPVRDTPFEDFIVEHAQADTEAFNAYVAKAEALVSSGATPSLFVALNQVAKAERIDVAHFFPQYELADVVNLDKRNTIMLRELLKMSQGRMRFGLDLAGGVSVTFKAKASQLSDVEYERSSQMDKAREIIAKRVDGFGVAEPLIRLKGSDRIEVQMPGVSTRDNPDIIDTIGKPALLEFCLVHRTADPRTTPTAPLGYRRMVEEREDQKTGRVQEIPYFVKSIPEMTGKSVDSASAAIGQFGGNMVNMQFTSEGSKRFADITRRIAEENERSGTQGQLAIVLDGQLRSAPRVSEPITGGSAQITGSFTQREAIDLANVLENPLELGLEVDEMSEVGPSLAAGAKIASLEAAIIGGALVIAFMVLYYWGSGIIAVITVGFNVLIVLGGLCYFGATLTLPGVAALVLTIGMAVDANILVLERVREELKAGKGPMQALEIGYDKVMSTIVDANVTTLITAALLAWLGSGPIKGFGITLTIGIFGTMFCALIASRWMMELLVSKGWLTRLVGFNFFSECKFEFLNYRKVAFASSWTIALLGLVFVAAHWGKIFGVDFIGGDEISMSYAVESLTIEDVDQTATMSVEDIRKLAASSTAANEQVKDSYQAVLEKGGFGEVTAAFQTTIGTDEHTLKLQTANLLGLAFADTLAQTWPDANLEVLSSQQIGPAVGSEVARSAVVSLLLALLGIGLYVALRFEWGFGVGAVVATVHDAIMTVGMFILLGELFGIGSGQFTAPMIAAILMVLGYSINDTIVVFDRIREELLLNPTMSLRDIVHLAINRTLARTILTSLTTFLATFALFLFAAGVVVDFALVFLIGIFTGTFSSIFIASPVFYWYHKGDRRKVEAEQEVPVYDWHTGEEGANS